mgnify:CR=1 FL=1
MAFKQVFIDLIEKAKTITGTNWQAVWNNQLDRMEDQSGLSLPFPALYFEIVPQEYNSLSLGVSQSELEIRIHVCHDQTDAGDGTFDQNLDYFDYRDAVKTAFTMFKPFNCGNMIASGEEQDYEHTDIYHGILSFKTCFVDTKGSPIDPENGTWIERMPPTELVVVYLEKDKNIFTDEFTSEFE